MFGSLYLLRDFAESLCVNDAEKQELASTWGVANVFAMAQNQIDTQYRFYQIFEPVYYKMLANYYVAALMGITSRRQGTDWKKGDKDAKAVEATFDKFVKNQKFDN